MPFPNAVAALRLPLPPSLRLPSIQSLKVPLRWPQLRLPPTLPSAPGPSRRLIPLPVSTATVVLLLVVPMVLNRIHVAGLPVAVATPAAALTVAQLRQLARAAGFRALARSGRRADLLAALALA